MLIFLLGYGVENRREPTHTLPTSCERITGAHESYSRL